MSNPEIVNAVAARTIAASPEALYDVVSDVTRIGEFSPECVSAKWVGGATGPEVGAKFKGTNVMGKNKWSTKPTITAAEPGRVFEFKVPGKSGPVWRYEFAETEGGTRVVESVSQTQPSPWFIRKIREKAGVHNRSANLTEAMTDTLRRIEAAVAA